MSSRVVIVADGEDGVRWTAALAVGSTPHRFLWGDGPEGPWCGVGAADAEPALATTAARSAWTAAEARGLAGSGATVATPGPPPAAARPAANLEHRDGPAVALIEALGRTRTRTAGSLRSALVTAARPGRGLEAWMALGPPLVAIPIRCWPGHPQAPDGAGAGPRPARLALLAHGVAEAVANGHLSHGEVAAALGPARGLAVREGGEADRQAGIMDAAGDDRGGAVRRIVAQVFAAGGAVAALEALLTAAGLAPAPR